MGGGAGFGPHDQRSAADIQRDLVEGYITSDGAAASGTQAPGRRTAAE